MLELKRRTLLTGAVATAALSFAPFGKARAQASAPQRGGHLRIGLAGGSSQDNLDPSNVVNVASYLMAGTARNKLLNVRSNGELLPALAVSWEPSEDLTRWTFEIRPGVTFHSGKPLEPADVIASLNLHRGDDSTSAAKAFVSSVTDIVADGDNRIVVSLDAPSVDFPSALGDLSMTIVPAKDGVADRNTTDGTGAYIIESFEPGQRIRFTRNPNYWDLNNAGFFDSAEVIILNDAAARMNALRSGQVDLINQPDLKTLNMLQRVPGITVEDVPSGRFYIFGMMSDVAPFNDKNVRQALRYAMKREEMVEKVLLGHGTIGNDQPIKPTHKYFNPDLPQREYDPERVRYHLEQAGLTSLQVPLSVAEAAFAGAVTAGQLFAASAADAGITIDLTREPDDGYFENVWLVKPFTADYWSQLPSADAQITQGYSQESPWNETHFQNARFNELLVEARATLDEQLRTEMYHEMQQLIHEESGAIIPMFANNTWACKSTLKHQQELGSHRDLDDFRCIERWWFEQ